MRGVWWVGVLVVTGFCAAVFVVGALIFGAGRWFQTWQAQR